MSFPSGKFINAQKTRSGERLLFIEAESFLLDFLSGNRFEALSHKTRTHSRCLRYMLHRLSTGKPTDLFSPSCGRPPSFSTSGIRFGKAFSARETLEAPFVKDQFHLMPSQSAITFLSPSCIVDLHTHPLAMRAGRLGSGGDDLNPEGTICEPFLPHNMQFGEVQWHQNAFFRCGFFCDMLAWQGLFSLRRLFLFLPSSTKDKPLTLFLLPIFLEFPPQGRRPSWR